MVIEVTCKDYLHGTKNQPKELSMKIRAERLNEFLCTLASCYGTDVTEYLDAQNWVDIARDGDVFKARDFTLKMPTERDI